MTTGAGPARESSAAPDGDRKAAGRTRSAFDRCVRPAAAGLRFSTTGSVLFLFAALSSAVSAACHQGPAGPTSVTILSLSPSTGPPGTAVTLVGSGFSPTLNTINFGNGTVSGVSSNGTNLIFTVPTTLIPACANSIPPCPFALQPTSAGVYNVSVTNALGTSNVVMFMVTN